MPGTISLSSRFLNRRIALGVTSGPVAIAITTTIVALARDLLPGAQDAETLMPPVARYWFRRVPAHNLWIYFAFDDVQLVIVTISARPPVPLID